MNKNHSQNGFTIIELMVATIIFSIILIVIISSLLQVGRMFYKGVSVANTNEAARTVVDDITSDLQLASDAVRATDISPGKQYFCIGAHRYTFVLGSKVGADDITSSYLRNPRNMRAGIVQDDSGGACIPPPMSGSPGRQLLGPDMQLNDMSFVPSVNGVNMHVHIIFYGADDTVFESNIAGMNNIPTDPNRAAGATDAFCSGNLLSTQFCAMADIRTTVLTRF